MAITRARPARSDHADGGTYRIDVSKVDTAVLRRITAMAFRFPGAWRRESRRRWRPR